MACKKNCFASFVALGMIAAIALSLSPRFVFAQTEYHIGSGRQSDGVRYFDTLEDLRLATATQDNDPVYGGYNYNLFENDTVILYADDDSLTAELGIADFANVTVRSNDPAVRRTIEMRSDTNGRFFNMNYPTAAGSTLNVQSVVMSNGRDFSGGGGGAIYAWWHNNIYLNNSQFTNNVSNYLGGAIYYWDALDGEIVDTDFINNATSYVGGAILINASGTLNLRDVTNITLRVTENAGRINGTPTATFSGNRDRVSFDTNGNVIAGTGTPNSIDFTGSTGKTVNFLIDTTEGTLLDMQDPFRTNASTGAGYTVNLDKIGLGTWKLGGASIIDGSRATTIRIQEGTLELYSGAEINAIGTNDSFTVAAGAEVLLNGDNRITGTTVTFNEDAVLSFNVENYQVGQTDAMLFLQGDNLTVAGTLINVNGIAPGQYGDFVLVEGAAALNIGDFDLWIGDANIDVSGRVSERFGYSLGHRTDGAGNVLDDKQLVLTVEETDNTVLRWNNGGASNQWNVVNENWTLIRDGSTDSFVPGDTVQFFGNGNHVVNLTEDALIKHNSVRDIEGKTWYAGSGDTTGMHVSGSGNWTFTGRSIVDSETLGRASRNLDLGGRCGEQLLLHRFGGHRETAHCKGRSTRYAGRLFPQQRHDKRSEQAAFHRRHHGRHSVDR